MISLSVSMGLGEALALTIFQCNFITHPFGCLFCFFLCMPANIGIEFNANRSLIGRLIKGFIELNAFFLCHVNTLAFKQNNAIDE